MTITGILRGPKEFVQENVSTWAENAAAWSAGKLIEEMAKETPPSPPRTPTAAVTVTHQIKHKSFLAALAGAIVGAVVAAVVAAAVVVATVALAKVVAAAIVGTALAAAASASAAAITTGAGLVVLKVVVSVLSSILLGDRVKNWVTDLLESDVADDGPVAAGAVNVWIEGRPAGRAGRDPVACVRHQTFPLPMIAEGSKTVEVNGHPLARINDMVECGAPLKQGATHVLIGGPTSRVCQVDNEFAWWQRLLLLAVEFVIPPTKKIGDMLDNFWRIAGKKTLQGIVWAARTTLATLARMKAGTIRMVKIGVSWLNSRASAIATSVRLAWQATKNYTNATVRVGIEKGRQLAADAVKKYNQLKTYVSNTLNRAANKGAEVAGEIKDKLESAWDQLTLPPPPPPPPPP